MPKPARVARDIMETDVLSVSPSSPLVDVQRLFVEEEIHGAPVVGDDGRICGVITSADLLRAISEEHDAGRGQADYLRDVLEFSAPDWSQMPEDFQDRLAQLVAEDFMTKDLVTVSPDDPVAEVARVMARDRVHRVFVTEGDELAGIITSFDLVSLLAKG